MTLRGLVDTPPVGGIVEEGKLYGTSVDIDDFQGVMLMRVKGKIGILRVEEGVGNNFI